MHRLNGLLLLLVLIFSLTLVTASSLLKESREADEPISSRYPIKLSATTFSTSANECPGNCSGHGTCEKNNLCSCDAYYEYPDCSEWIMNVTGNSIFIYSFGFPSIQFFVALWTMSGIVFNYKMQKKSDLKLWKQNKNSACVFPSIFFRKSFWDLSNLTMFFGSLASWARICWILFQITTIILKRPNLEAENIIWSISSLLYISVYALIALFWLELQRTFRSKSSSNWKLNLKRVRLGVLILVLLAAIILVPTLLLHIIPSLQTIMSYLFQVGIAVYLLATAILLFYCIARIWHLFPARGSTSSSSTMKTLRQVTILIVFANCGVILIVVLDIVFLILNPYSYYPLEYIIQQSLERIVNIFLVNIPIVYAVHPIRSYGWKNFLAFLFMGASVKSMISTTSSGKSAEAQRPIYLQADESNNSLERTSTAEVKIEANSDVITGNLTSKEEVSEGDEGSEGCDLP